jgi:hypothetical protein
MRRIEAKQLTLFPDLVVEPRVQLKPMPEQSEKAFMVEVMTAAELIGLPSVHLQTYHENSFWVTCGQCGARVLATCRKPVNAEYAGWPDIIGVAWAVECKRNRNLNGDPFLPSAEQRGRMDNLSAVGVPVLLANPARKQETIDFLRKIKNCQ